MKCRHCGAELRLPFLDLGVAPPSNAYLTADKLPGRPPARHPPIPTTSQSGKVVVLAMIFSRKCLGFERIGSNFWP